MVDPAQKQTGPIPVNPGARCDPKIMKICFDNGGRWAPGGCILRLQLVAHGSVSRAAWSAHTRAKAILHSADRSQVDGTVLFL